MAMLLCLHRRICEQDVKARTYRGSWQLGVAVLPRGVHFHAPTYGAVTALAGATIEMGIKSSVESDFRVSL